MSELDICLVSGNVIDYIDQLSVHQTDFLLSDHAPISVKLFIPETDIDDFFLVGYVCYLGEHTAWSQPYGFR